MKKFSIYILILCLTFVFVSFCTSNIYAYDSIDSTKTTTWTKSSEEVIKKYGVTYSHMTGTAKINGTNNPERNVNFFSMAPSDNEAKLVTWAIQSANNGFVTSALSSIAKNYEKNHPGWIVVAGVNADQWYYETTETNPKGGYFYFKNQSYYPFSMDYQNLFTINPLGVTVNGVAINNDSTNLLTEVGDTLNIELQVYDENDNLIKSFVVDGYNQDIPSGGTVVYSGYLSSNLSGFVKKEVTSSNDIYVIDNSELSYMNNSKDYPSADMYHPTDSFYGRGKITSISNSAILDSGDFAIETQNEELKALLGVGVKVIVEQQYTLSSNPESVSGYHTVQVKNGEYYDSTATYNTGGRGRSFFGITKTGEYFLMTTRNVSSLSGGTVHTENNAILSYYNADTCYQHDGGGSSTAIYRNDTGGFDVVSESTDSGKKERNVFSGLFFVVRDPGVKSEAKNSTSYSVLLEKNTLGKEFTDICVTINNKTYELTSDNLLIDDLEENKNYEVKVSYKYQGIAYQATTYASTLTYTPDLNFNATSDAITISKRNENERYKILSIEFTLIDEVYKTSDDIYTIEGLFKDTEYELSYICTILNTKTNELFVSKEYIKNFKTMKYAVPKIEQFEEYSNNSSGLKIKYSVSDPDTTIEKMYILCNGAKYYLTDLAGTFTYTDKSLNFKDHTFELCITYKTPDYYTGEVKSATLSYISTHEHTIVNATCISKAYCSECAEEFGELGEHEYTPATKKSPSKCIHCGVTTGEKLKGCASCNTYVIIAMITAFIVPFLYIRKRS